MVQTSGNMCDEGVVLGYIMQSKVKFKLAPLRRYSHKSADLGVNEGMRKLDFKCTPSNNNLVLKTLFCLQFKKAEHNTTSRL